MNKVILQIILVILVLGCSTIPNEVIDITEIDYSVIGGMEGVENIYTVPDSMDLYVSDCSGHLYKVSYNDKFEITKKVKVGDFALGITMDKGNLYFAASECDWSNVGGSIYKTDSSLTKVEKITKKYPGINGVTSDDKSNIYFTIGKMNPIDKSGIIYKFNSTSMKAEPEAFLTDLKCPNGLDYDKKNNRLIFSETFKGINEMDLYTKQKTEVFGKSRVVEGFDDVCKDSKGNYWVGDQPNGFIKMYNPKQNRVFYFRSKQLGVSSSCKIRIENGKEILYVAEIKRTQKSKKYDGRGVFIFDLEDFRILIDEN